MDIQPSFIEQIVATQTDWFELMVLRCVISDGDFRQRAMKVLCIDPKTRKPIKDFSTDIDNAIYTAAFMFVQTTGGRVQMPLPFAESILTHIGNQADLIGLGEVPMAMYRLQTCLNLDLAPALSLVNQGFKIWLNKRRTERVVRAHTASPTWSASEMMDEARLNSHAIDLSSGTDTFFEFGASLDTRKLDVERVPIANLRSLTNALGGGFARKEGTLIVAPEGSGKTVLACQLGSTLTAHQKQVGIIISTEQNNDELEPRVIACNCMIPYEGIKDKFDVTLLNAAQRERYEDFRQKIKGKLFWENWGDADHGMSIEHDLLQLIERRQDEIGRKVDFIILDWIGGALGKMSAEDRDRLTSVMQIAGDTVCQIAKDRNMFTIAFAQASMALAVNRKRVDAQCIANCKSLGQKFTNVLGLTMMYVENLNLNEGDEPIYDNRQYFYISKGRKSKGGCIPFLRKFDFQRMADITDRQGG